MEERPHFSGNSAPHGYDCHFMFWQLGV